ncbi:MAG TPA: response regulator [Vicinamibacterales bacterium]|jgi:CheY-like chemotaxis protein
MPFRLLIVDPELSSREAVERVLTTGTSHFATSVSTFQDAKQRLALAPPDLLVTAVKLGAFNGIQLVLRASPDLPAVVIDDSYDPVLEKEAISAGAVYLTRPMDDAAIVSVVERLLGDTPVQTSSAVARRWPRKNADMTVDISGDAVRVVDVSYGGLRLELTGAPEEALLTIEAVAIPTVGVVAIHPIWARVAAVGTPRWWCGAEVDVSDEQSGDVWRRFVDSLN